MPRHVVLLGDSIFDNQSYTRGEPDVVTHLRTLLASRDQATLCAVDGATTAGIARQLAKLPSDATHLVVSVGGNDALGNIDMLNTPVRSTAEALALFDTRIHRFEQDYRAALSPVQALGRPTFVCTIYNGALVDKREARHARLALMMFNDVIVRVAFELGFSVIELRAICTEPSDYANPIEPSGTGGLKIAQAIARALEAPAAAPAHRIFRS